MFDRCHVHFDEAERRHDDDETFRRLSPLRFWWRPSSLSQVADRLFSSFGQDILDALYWTATEPKERKRDSIGVIPHFLMAVLYVCILLVNEGSREHARNGLFLCRVRWRCVTWPTDGRIKSVSDFFQWDGRELKDRYWFIFSAGQKDLDQCIMGICAFSKVHLCIWFFYPSFSILINAWINSNGHANGHSVERIASHIARLGIELWTFWHYLHANWIQMYRTMVRFDFFMTLTLTFDPIDPKIESNGPRIITNHPTKCHAIRFNTFWLMRITRTHTNTRRSKHNLPHFQCEGNDLFCTFWAFN